MRESQLFSCLHVLSSSQCFVIPSLLRHGLCLCDVVALVDVRVGSAMSLLATHAQPAESVSTLATRNVHAALVLLDVCKAFGAWLGVQSDPFLGLRLLLLGTTDHLASHAWIVNRNSRLSFNRGKPSL